MNRLFSSAVVFLALAGCGMNEPTNNANVDPASLDAATKARVLLQGVPGGTGARIPQEANGGATVGNGTQRRTSTSSL
jgi:hypothetical protein